MMSCAAASFDTILSIRLVHMAIPSRSRPFFLCTECLQSNGFGSAGTTRPALGPFQQIRGKKKKSTRGPTTLPARLLEDVKAFGRKGTDVVVSQDLATVADIRQ